MKKLLTMLAVSTLAGTSASNLKPMFTSNINNSFKSKQVNNKDISITNENETNPFYPKQLPSLNEQGIGAFAVDSSNNVYAGTTDGLYKSTDGINLDKINESPNNIMFNSLVVTSNNVVYIGTYKGNGGIWTINLIEQLIKINKPDTFDNSWPKYKGIVYNSVQKIDIKENLVARAKLENKNIYENTSPKFNDEEEEKLKLEAAEFWNKLDNIKTVLATAGFWAVDWLGGISIPHEQLLQLLRQQLWG